MRLADAVQQYIDWHHSQAHSRWTIISVRSRLKNLVQNLGAERDLAAINSDDIAAHFHHLRESGLAIGTLAGHKSTIRAFWNWAVGAGLTETDATVILKRKRHNYTFDPVHSRAVPHDHLQRVINAIPSFIAARGYRPRDVRDAALLSLTIDSSARRGELHQLRRVDIEHALQRPRRLENGRNVYHVSSSGKTGAVRLRFFDETADLLRMWLNLMPDKSVWLWCSLNTGLRLNIHALWLGFKRICRFAGVPPFRFHAVRKRDVTDIIALSGDQKLGQLYAGHADGRTTQRYYNDVQQERVDQAAAHLADRRRGHVSLADAFFRRLDSE